MARNGTESPGLSPEPDEDGMTTIPPEFWQNFMGEFLAQHVSPFDPLVWIKLYDDGRVTYENWTRGTFAVRFPDGKETRVTNVVLDRETLMRAFPPPTIQ